MYRWTIHQILRFGWWGRQRQSGRLWGRQHATRRFAIMSKTEQRGKGGLEFAGLFTGVAFISQFPMPPVPSDSSFQFARSSTYGITINIYLVEIIMYDNDALIKSRIVIITLVVVVTVNS